jgi:hypothetical protein
VLLIAVEAVTAAVAGLLTRRQLLSTVLLLLLRAARVRYCGCLLLLAVLKSGKTLEGDAPLALTVATL